MKPGLAKPFSKKSNNSIEKLTVAFCLLVSLFSSSPTLSQVGSSGSYKTIHVKFKEEFRPSVPTNGRSAVSGMGKMDKVSKKHNALSIQRIFPDAGVYEAAHRAYGLNLWYEIKFGKDVSLAKAMEDYIELDYFQNVEECKEYKADWERNDASPELPTGTNDPQFMNQWHFANSGQTGGKPGADINLLKAWQIETGSPNVVVAVIDGGIDLHHPDLEGALWKNSDEIPSNGIDDDHNGYIDDVHGYGFGDNSSTIPADRHATHVAGIIGAISNNGVGVSGIAGGSGVNDGVRLMSCAAFGTFANRGFEAAMVYAADNGAVIAQNSWGGGSTAIEDAIDYFVSRAGYDNSAANFSANIQTGPMAGGLVIFAAGNANSDNWRVGFPASYANVIAVASTDHKDVKSSFSNFGSWVDISAPGSEVLSTGLFGGYESLSGTSMACPHVSGVAALIISNQQRQGFTSFEVRNRLIISAHSIDTENPSMIRKLGAGRVDAFGALHEPDIIPPGDVTDLRVVRPHYSSVLLQWTATGASGLIGQASEYELRYSTSPITAINFGSATLVSNPPLPLPAGEQVTCVIPGLAAETSYFIALKSRDLFRNVSSISNVVNITTLRPPRLEVLTGQISEQLFTGGIASQELVVRNAGDDELLVRLGVPDIDPAPVGLASGAKGRLFAIDRDDNKIDELHPRSGAVISSISLPESLTEEANALAFDGKNLYVGVGQMIYTINAENGQVLRSFRVGVVYGINGMGWSGRYLYISDRSANSTYEIDPDNGTTIRKLPFGAEGLTFGGIRGTLFISETGTIAEINIATGEVMRRINHDLGGSITGLGYSGVENVIFISDGSGNIQAIDPDSGEIRYKISHTNTTALAADEFKPGWLVVDGYPTTIAPGATASLPVTFTATSLPTGQWAGRLKVIPMNAVPGSPVAVPVNLKVIGASDIETANEIDLGTQFIGYPFDSVISISNRGTSTLTISDIHSNDARITHSHSSVTLAPGQKVEMTVTISAAAAGVVDASLTFLSDDPDEGALSIPVHAEIFLPPAIELNPTNLSTTLSTGESTTLSFTAKNTGLSMLHWKTSLAGTELLSITPASITQTRDGVNPLELDEITLRASSPEPLTCLSHDPQSGFIYAKSLSGTTFYRYDPISDRWSANGTTPASLMGQAAYLAGKIYHAGSQLGVYTIQTNSWTTVSFPIEGITGNLATDGQYIYVTFDAAFYRYDPVGNTWLPLASLPRSIGANGGLSFYKGALYAHEDKTGHFGENTRFYSYSIATDKWQERPDFDFNIAASSGSAIDPAGRYFAVSGLVMYILDLHEGEWVKAENPFSVGGISGLVFVSKQGASGIYVVQGSNGTGFCRYETAPANDWLATSPEHGELLPGETQTFNVIVNAQTLDAGTYNKDITVFSNHPAIAATLPVSVTVNGSPDISINRTMVDVGEVHLGVSRGIDIKIKNTGTAPLSVSNVTTDRPDFTVSHASFTLQTGEVQIISTSFEPTTSGPQTGIFKFVSNDPDEGTIEFVFKGIGVTPAIPSVTPGTISASLLTGAKSVQQLEISNAGEATMYYDIDLESSGNWLTAPTTYGLLGNGESRKLDIVLDAGGKPTGTYTGKVRFYVHPDFESEIPVTMTVTGAPDILISNQNIIYGEQFLNNAYDSIIQIKNDGVFPLSITSIDIDNPAFSISVAEPLNLAPGESLEATVRFTPGTLTSQTGKITFLSNDPDEPAFVVLLSGTGIVPPLLSPSITQLSASAPTNESTTQTLTLLNSGGTDLTWRVKEQFGPLPSSVDEVGDSNEPLSVGDFTLLTPSPMPLVSPVVDPSNGMIYAQDSDRREISVYDFYHKQWSRSANMPDFTTFGVGGSVFLNSKMYCVHANNPATIYIYNRAIDYWSTIPNGLGTGTATITTDGTLLYLAGGGKFKSFNPKTKIWTDLPIPTINLDGSGGLSFDNGAIYAREGNGNGFAKYTIATRTWENLAPLPGYAALGSTIDPLKRRYYAYGKISDSYLYEYDITSNLWNVLTIPFFKVGDGGIVYTQYSGAEGVYFLQGAPGKGFARYEPRTDFPWFRVSHLTGDIPASGAQTITVNFNAFGLSPGEYNAYIELTSNDPAHSRMNIPVTFIVTGPPKIEVPKLIEATVDANISRQYYFQLRIENKGHDVLQWNFANPLPSTLTASKTAGAISKENFEDLEIAFDPAPLAPGVYTYELNFNSNDVANKNVKTVLQFFVIKNQPPVVAEPIQSQSLKVNPLLLSLEGTFRDPDTDRLTYSASSANPEVARVNMNGYLLTIIPVSSGTSIITVTASDVFNASVSTSFSVNVDQVVAVEEVEPKSFLSAVPNPFNKEVVLRYDADNPGFATLVIFDISGRIVWNLNEFSEVHGRNEIILNGRDLAPGIYNCRLTRNGNEVRTIRLVRQ